MSDVEKYAQFISEQRKDNPFRPVSLKEAATLHAADYDTGKGFGTVDKLKALHDKHKFSGVEFHTAAGDDEPHAVTVKHNSDALKHPEFVKHMKKLPIHEPED